METLYGNAVVITWLGADHTYVTSGDGRTWPCWGRNKGGNVVCHGTGSADAADCLSQEKSHAGLLYGITGVCHQTANRILYPAKCLVSAARGYWASSAIYGTYGLDQEGWQQRQMNCRANLSGGVNLDDAPGGPKSYREEILELHAKSAGTLENIYSDVVPKILQHEMRLLLKHRLGRKYPGRKINAVYKRHHSLHSRKKNLEAEYGRNKMSGREFAKRANAIFTDEFKKIGAVIKKDDYKKLFYSELGARVDIVDPKIMPNSKGK